jgi:GST-like protein
MIELFGDATGNCFRVAIALEESGLPYRLRKVDLAGGGQRDPTYLSLNPFGRVPTIVEHQGAGREPFVLSQSNAILIYVSEKSGRLLPQEGAARARALEWLLLFVTDVIAPNNLGFQLARTLGPALASEAIQVLKQRPLSVYDPFNKQLGSHAFVAGETLTIADIAAYTITAALSDQLQWDTLPHVRRWFAMLRERRGFQRGMLAFRQ